LASISFNMASIPRATSAASVASSSPPRATSHVVGSREQTDRFRVDVIKLAVLQPPQNILDFVRAPPEVSRVPSEEIAVPVRKQLGIIRGAPPADDRVAFEVDIDAALARLFEKLPMSQHRVGVGSRRGPIRRLGE
jgi:hypothetical protein